MPRVNAVDRRRRAVYVVRESDGGSWMGFPIAVLGNPCCFSFLSFFLLRHGGDFYFFGPLHLACLLAS